MNGSTLEILAGFYVLAVIGLGIFLDSKKGISFALTYSWGIAVGYGVHALSAAFIRPYRIDASEVVITIALFAFAAYVTGRKGLG